MGDNEEGVFFIGGEGDMPDEIKELLRALTARSLYSHGTHDVAAEDVVKPSAEQFDLGPGDFVSLSASGESEEDTMVIAKLLDPKDHQDEFPDWEDRLMNSFVFGTWYAPDQTEGELGWFPRSRLIKLDEEQFDIMMDAALGLVELYDPVDGIPDWLLKRYNESVVGINEANDHFMPDPHACEKCGSIAVVLDMTQRMRKTFCVGHLRNDPDKNPEDLYVFAQYGESSDQDATLTCKSCGHSIDANELSVNLYLKP